MSICPSTAVPIDLNSLLIRGDLSLPMVSFGVAVVKGGERLASFAL